MIVNQSDLSYTYNLSDVLNRFFILLEYLWKVKENQMMAKLNVIYIHLGILIIYGLLAISVLIRKS